MYGDSYLAHGGMILLRGRHSWFWELNIWYSMKDHLGETKSMIQQPDVTGWVRRCCGSQSDAESRLQRLLDET